MNNSVLQSVYLFVLMISIPMFCGAAATSVESAESPEGVTLQVQPQQESTQSQQASEQGSASVMGSFATDKSAKSELVQIEDQTKRLVMFVMGVPLLILLFATAALGVAMGVYGKQVFVPHMVCAGLSLTLALGHAVVGIVWFYPF